MRGNCMKLFTRILNALLAIAILCTLIAAVGSAITKKPVLLSVIRSNSMHPVWERGDMVIIKNLNEKDLIQNGDIVFFETEEGSLSDKGWIAHRVMDGNATHGFVTKGDANDYTDQNDGTGLIEREWIAAKAYTIGETPIVIPKLGHLSLLVEKYQGNSFLLPAIALILSCLNRIWRIKVCTNSKKERNRN